jgi:hypothetical protein
MERLLKSYKLGILKKTKGTLPVKQEFESMDIFYDSLINYGLSETQKNIVADVLESQEVPAKQLSEIQKNIVADVLESQEVPAKQLYTLTDEKLEKMGLI